MNFAYNLKRPKPVDGEDELFRMQDDFLKSKEQPSAKVINLRGQYKQHHDQQLLNKELIENDESKINEVRKSAHQSMATTTKIHSKFAQRKAQREREKISTSQLGGDIITPELVDMIEGIKKESVKERDDSIHNIRTDLLGIVMGNIVERKHGKHHKLLSTSSFNDGELCDTGFPKPFSIGPCLVNKIPPNDSGSLFYQAIMSTKKRIIHSGSKDLLAGQSTDTMDVDPPEICSSITSEQSVLVEGPLGTEIHKENLNTLSEMSEENILKQKAMLESTLSPEIIQFLQGKKRKMQNVRKDQPIGISVNKIMSEVKEVISETFDSSGPALKFPKFEPLASQSTKLIMEPVKKYSELDQSVQNPTESNLLELLEKSLELSKSPTKNKNEIESNKNIMEIKERLFDPPAPVAKIVEEATKKGWEHMDEVESVKLEWMKDISSNKSLPSPDEPYDARFDFSGMLLPFKDESITVDEGLHHHGDEPDRPGYTLQELIQLSRSAAQQQRVVALTTIGNILEKSRKGIYDKVLQPPPLTVLNEHHVMLLLRFCLDDSSPAVGTAALRALRSFFYSEADEICLDRLYSWTYADGNCIISELPAPKHDVEDTTTLKDHELVQLDCVAAAVRSDIVLRIRYILSEMHPPPVGVTAALEILIRLSRHSRVTALNIATTPQLLEVIVKKFIPLSTQRLVDVDIPTAYGVPNVSAVRLCRILLEYAGRPVGDRINNFKIVHSLISYITTDTGEAGLRLSIEALRLWRLLIVHGLALDSLSAASQLLASHLKLLLANHDLANSSECSCEYATELVHISGLETTLKPIIAKLLMKWSTQLAHMSAVTWSNTKLVSVTLETLSDATAFETNWISNAGIFSNICSTSNLLSGCLPASDRDPSSLPSLGVIIKDGQLQPAVSIHSSFPFLTTVTNILIKNKMFNELEVMLQNADMIKYLRRLVSNDWTLQNSWYTRPELAFITALIRSCEQIDTSNLTNEIIWKIAVKLIPVLPSDAIETVKEVLEIIFSNEKMTLLALSDSLSNLKLGNSNENNINLQLHNNNISNMYAQHISRECNWNQPAMPKDWTYLPLIALYSRHKNRTDWNEEDTSKIIILLSLHLTAPELFHDLAPTLRYSRIVLVFLCETVYLNEKVVSLLCQLMFKLIPKHYKSFDFASELAGLTSFTDLYTSMCESYCANSYGDNNFCMAMLVPLAQRHNIHYRKMLWSEHAGALRYLKLSPEKLLIPLREFLYPTEEDPSLIENYITALVRGSVRKEWCPVLYLIAVHHSAIFIRGTSKLAQRMKASIRTIKDTNFAEILLNYSENS